MGDLAAPPRLYTFLVRGALPFLRAFRLRVEGLENIPKEGGFVLAANHISNIDPWPLGVPLYPRQLHFMARSSLYWPGLRRLLNATGAFPVNRDERDPQAFKTAVRLARAGEVIAIFPEGTRRKKGMFKRRAARPHPGAARIALAAGVPLVPAAIVGTDRLTRLGPLRVLYGAPIDVNGIPGGTHRRAAEEATERLMEAIAELERTVPGDARPAP